MGRLTLGVVALGFASLGGAGAGGAEAPLALAMEADQALYPKGTPILLRITLHNSGADAYTFPGPIGWGRHLAILCGVGDAELKSVAPDVNHGDTQLGPWYMPIYYLTGRVAPGKSQTLFHMLPTAELAPGVVRLKGWMDLGRGQRLETDTILLTLAVRAKEGNGALFNPQEQQLVFRHAVAAHNHFGRAWREPRPSRDVVAIVRKALESPAAALDVYYALYVGAFLSAHPQAAPQELDLAEQGARAFLERFPESWLRAHVHAALFGTYLRKAEAAADAGQALPEATPLYDNLGLTDQLKLLDRGRIRTPARRTR